MIFICIFSNFRYEICYVEDIAFYELATPKYDVIDWNYRASKGGDGVPLPKGRQETAASESTSELIYFN